MLLKSTLFTKAVFFTGKEIFTPLTIFAPSALHVFLIMRCAVLVYVLPTKYVTVPYHYYDCSRDDRTYLRSVEVNLLKLMKFQGLFTVCPRPL